MTAKEFFGEEEFFGDHKRKHNARAASHHVLALFLPSSLLAKYKAVSTVKNLAPLTIEKMIRIARQRNRDIQSFPFEEKISLINPPPKIPENPLIEKFYDSEIKKNIKRKNKDYNNSYFKYYRNEHKLHVKEAEKKDISFEDLLSNKLYFRIRNNKHSRKKEYFRKVVDFIGEEDEKLSPELKRASPEGLLKNKQSESKVLMTETSIDYSPQPSSREYAKTHELWKKANVQAILESAAFNDYFFPKPLQSSRDNFTSTQKLITTASTASFRSDKKKLMQSYSNLLNSSRRMSTEPRNLADLKISDILRSTPVKLQESILQSHSEKKTTKVNSETQTQTTILRARPQTQPPLQRNTRSQQVQTQINISVLKSQSHSQNDNPIPISIRNKEAKRTSLSPEPREENLYNLDSSRSNLGNARVMIKSRHNQFRLKPKDKLVLTERYLI